MAHKLDAEHPQYQEHSQDWKLMSDALRGQRAVKDAGEEYLPKTPGMLLADDTATGQASRGGQSRYDAYRMRAEFPEKVAPACESAVGLFTDKKATVELPDAWEGLLEFATPDGDTLHELHRFLSQSICGFGRAGLWSDVRNDGLVPYFIKYGAQQIINWSESVINNERVLDRLVIKTGDQDDDGNEIKVLRIYTLREAGVFAQRFVNADRDDNWIEVDARQPMTRRTDMGAALETENGGVAGFRLARIPFTFVNTDSVKPAVSRLPFLALANQCLKIYRMDANYQEAQSFYEPTPFVTGLTKEWIDGGYAPKTLGAGTAWWLPDGATAGMLEYTGPSIANMRQAIIDAQERADELAKRPFEPKINSVESGDAKKERRRTQTSAVKVMAQNIGSGIERALRVSADWLGQDRDKVSFEPSLDFVEAILEPQTLIAYLGAWQSGAFSKQTLHENLQRGGVTDRTFEEEQDLIDQDPPAFADG